MARRDGESGRAGGYGTHSEVRWAELGQIEEFAADLPEEFLLCREMGHRWLPYQATQNADGTFHRTLRCPRCRTRKEQEIGSRGAILSTQYKHPDGYLHQGMGRIAGEGRGILRLESIRRTIANFEEKQDKRSREQPEG